MCFMFCMFALLGGWVASLPSSRVINDVMQLLATHPKNILLKQGHLPIVGVGVCKRNNQQPITLHFWLAIQIINYQSDLHLMALHTMVAQSKFDPRKLGSSVRPHPFVELNSPGIGPIQHNRRTSLDCPLDRWSGSGLHFGQLLSYRSILRPWWNISEGTTIEK